MKYKLLTLLCSTLLIVGCDKFKTSAKDNVSCNDEATKNFVAEVFSKNLNDSASERVKQLIAEENLTLNMGKLNQILKQIKVNVDDVRTNNSEKNSKKEFCVTSFTVTIPTQTLKDANISRELYGQATVARTAASVDLKFSGNKLNKELEYVVQPTDDGKKVYVTLENSDELITFVRDIAVDSLLKSKRQQAVEAIREDNQIQREQESREDAEMYADEYEYENILQEEAKAAFDKADQKFNRVWNEASADMRNELLDEQRRWVKKRGLECKLTSSDTDNPEVSRINCEAQMTVERTEYLQEKISESEH